MLLILSSRTFLMVVFFDLSPESMPTLLYKYRVTLGSVVATIPNTLWTTFSNAAGTALAHRLNEWENHRTQVGHAPTTS